MQYKILALDLDGTLTNDNKDITPRTMAALQRAIEQGVRIVLASGRPTVGIRPLAELLQLDKNGGYIASYNGGKIVDCASGETLVQVRFPAELIGPICDFAHEQGVVALSYDERGIVTEQPRDEYVQKEAFTNKIEAFRVDDLAAYLRYPINKLLLVGEPSHLAQVETEMAKRFGHLLGVYRSTPYFLEAVPLGVEKSASLARLLEKLGLTREELMACGDSWNDAPMVAFAGMGVAMENAVEEVKAAADYITADNNHDGVGLAVEKWILGEEA